MAVNSGVLLPPRAQVTQAESRLTPDMGFVEAFRALSRQLREERRLKLYDITHHVRRSESAISKWESGETRQPDNLDRFLDGYAEAFQMTTSELVEQISQRMRDDADEFAKTLTEPPADTSSKAGRSARRRRAS